MSLNRTILHHVAYSCGRGGRILEAVSRVQAKEMKCPLLNILISEEEGAQRGPFQLLIILVVIYYEMPLSR